MSGPAGLAVTEPAARPSPLKAIGWAALFIGGGLVLTVLLGTLLTLAGGGSPATGTSARALLLQSASGLLAFGALTLVLGVRVLRLTATDLRWKPTRFALPGFGLGFLLGALAAAGAVGLSVVVASARFLPDEGGAWAYLGQVLKLALLLAPAALLEEVMFRGVGQVVLARAIGRVRAILFFSALFALAHLLNPNGTALGLFNIGLAGVFLGLAFYAPGGIWTAWGAHLGWNVALAALDAPVSGVPFEIPLIDYLPGGPWWLTGGNFGPEGGLLATGAIAAATAAAWRWTRKEPA